MYRLSFYIYIYERFLVQFFTWKVYYVVMLRTCQKDSIRNDKNEIIQ